MATDSTELTFVRCPSCRSLVPAVSTRCRMCGATLDTSLDRSGQDQSGSPASSSDGDPKKSGRVRQRTMSQPDSELESAASKLRSEGTVLQASESVESDSVANVTESVPPVGQPKTGPRSGARVIEAAPPPTLGLSDEDNVDSLADPLGEYLDEPVETGMDSVDSHDSGHVEAGPESEYAAGQEAISSKIESLVKGRVEMPAPAPVQTQVTQPASALSNVAPTNGHSGPAPKIPPVESSQALESDEAELETSEAKPRVIVESGPRKPGKPSGLSFGRPRDEKQQPDRPAENKSFDNRQRDNRPGEEKPRQEKGQERSQDRGREDRGRDNQSARDSHQSNKPREERRDQPRNDRRDERRDDRREERRFGGGREERNLPAFAQRDKDRSPGSSPKQADSMSGRLCGWLVSYADPQGKARELREGKFFVTGSSLKKADFVIDDSSVSTPHALVTVGHDGALQLQDLMSERGVFVRRQGSDAYHREDEPVTVTHGDWVRFGDVEMLVSLIPYVGVK